MSQNFEPPYSVSLQFGPHIVHGHAQESVFGEVMQNLLLREINKSCSEMFDKMANQPVAAPSFECETRDASSILAFVDRWSKMMDDQPAVREFEPCSVPDWMRPGLRNKGMTDAEIDSILITGIEPSFDGTPGVVLKTVTL